MLVCGAVAPVESSRLEVGCLLHVDGRPEPRDANGLAGIAVGDGWPVGREPLIATVRRVFIFKGGSRA